MTHADFERFKTAPLADFPDDLGCELLVARELLDTLHDTFATFDCWRNPTYCDAFTALVFAARDILSDAKALCDHFARRALTEGR